MKAKSGFRKTSHQGAFLFFVVGLFLLQVIFAFTIHGDIGPQFPRGSGAFTSSSQALLGKMETIIETTAPERTRLTLQPQAAQAPAVRADFSRPPAVEAIPSQVQKKGLELRETGNRYYEYVVHSGDSLHSISRRLYGKRNMVTVLARLNRIADEKGLRTGQVLRVPRQGLIVAN
jgi:hypothetical protein